MRKMHKLPTDLKRQMDRNEMKADVIVGKEDSQSALIVDSVLLCKCCSSTKVENLPVVKACI